MTAEKRLFHVYLFGAFYGYAWAVSATEAISKVKPSEWDDDGFTTQVDCK